MLRARENEAARFGILVDVRLNVAEQFGDVLNLVENRTVRVLGEKAARVAADELARIERLEVDVRLLRECRPASVVFPDWRGPVRVTTGIFAADRTSSTASSLGIMHGS